MTLGRFRFELGISLVLFHPDAAVMGGGHLGLSEHGEDAMSRMSDLDAELQRFADLDFAVRNYLSHLWAFEQGEMDEAGLDYWRDRLGDLTAGEMFEVVR